MTTKVRKWGNSLAVRLPKEVARRLALKEGSDVVVRHDAEAIIIRRQESAGRCASKKDWRRYVIPTKRKRENVSGRVDAILYGVSR